MLDNRVKELIAIGALVTANWHQSLENFISLAKSNGAKEDEINEAMEIGAIVLKRQLKLATTREGIQRLRWINLT